MRRYATVAQFDASPFSEGDDGSTITVTQKALDRAAAQIDSLLKTARYTVDTAGMPTDPDILQLLTDATCAQAGFNAQTGNLSGAAALGPDVTLGPLSLSSPRASSVASTSSGGASFSQEAVDILAPLRTTAVGNW